MNQLRFLLLTTLTLLPASRLWADIYNAPVVCNDGTIPVSVARAFRQKIIFSSSQWVIQGWYSVGPGVCSDIGPKERYTSGGWLEDDSVILLAFAFRDSSGVWGAARVRDTTDGLFKPSNQQLCVQNGAFRYGRDTSQGDPAKECDRGLPGYYRIPVSLEFKGDSYRPNDPGPRDHLRVSFGPNDRAIPLGPQSSSTTSSNAGQKPAADDGNSFGAQVLKALAKSIVEAGNKPVSRPDPAATEAESRAAMLKWVREDLTAYIAASATGFEAYKKGDSFMFGAARAWNSKESPLASKGCWVIEGGPNTFSCLLSSSTDLSGLRAYYAELTDAVSASLPQGWRSDATPPFAADLPSKAFRSSSGAYGEVWIVAAAGGRYELRYDLVAAQAYRPAVNPKPASTAPDDDPIGPGGFIKPPDRAR